MHASVNTRHFFHKQWNNLTDPKCILQNKCCQDAVRMWTCGLRVKLLIFGETTCWGNPWAISTACVWLQRGSPPAAQNAGSVFSSCRVIEEHIELASGPAGKVSKVMATLLSGHSSPIHTSLRQVISTARSNKNHHCQYLITFTMSRKP